MGVYQRVYGSFGHTAIWRRLRDVRWLRSGVLLAVELRKSLAERDVVSPEAVDRDFRQRTDPFRYLSNPAEQIRFGIMRDMLDRARGGGLFTRALEIGGAEGAFTGVLADRCETLLELDLSPTALARNEARHGSRGNLEFRCWDLRTEPLPGTFDLIVLAGVLEYFSRRRTLRALRTKLVDGLNPGGYLLLESTRTPSSVEDAWWARRLIRGRWINEFVAEDDALDVLDRADTAEFAMLMCRKKSLTATRATAA